MTQPVGTQGNISNIDKLVIEGQAIQTSTEPYKKFSYINWADTYRRYKIWNEDIRKGFNAMKLPHLLPSNFFMNEDLSFPDKSTRINVGEDYSHEFRKNLFEIIEKQVKVLNDVRKKLLDEKDIFLLYLNSKGKLWRVPEDRYFHEMQKSEKRYKFIKHLADKKEFEKTRVLIQKIKYLDTAMVAKEKRGINKVMRKALFIDYDFIDGKRGPGYRINPAITIEVIE